MAELRTREMVIVAQDPGVKRDGRILTAKVSVPWEILKKGPVGHRVSVVDYDASTQTMYSAAAPEDALPEDDAELLGDPRFHARNAYALVMRTLGRFEYALGRRVGWGFEAHQLKVIPHAFEDMNAFYSPETEALVFGYYRTDEGLAFTCLSHDIVVHETSHALLDGLRKRFTRPSSPDQAAFHEAFGDIVALLSVFSLGAVLRTLIEHRESEEGDDATPPGLIAAERVSTEALMGSVLFGLAEQMGTEAGSARSRALRRSVEIEPDARILGRLEFQEAHRRGEVLVAAVMRAFVAAWSFRLTSLGKVEDKYYDIGRVVEEGESIAEVLLTMAIRAIDYMPPIHIEFGDYLSALLTADSQIRASDHQYRLRDELIEWFAKYGIQPASTDDGGTWMPPPSPLDNQGVRFQGLQTDPIEMFRLLWANHRRLNLDPGAFTRVESVRPCVRISPEDGMPLRETVAECTQYVKLRARDLGKFGLVAPSGMPADQEVTLEGGSTLIFDEYGRLKYDIHNRLPSKRRDSDPVEAQERLQYLWEQGAFSAGSSFKARFSALHRRRSGLPAFDDHDEVW
ncbi:MAG TPA: hypothetical protein VHR18_00275 [Solirubrobacterales bacterium]|jgi:hypothetical protein|nr:hypothetical protein [Solirubrobacterales bacterium]